MIKNVLFDFAGTIADLSPSSEDMLCSYVDKFCDFKLDKERAREAFACLDKHMFYSSVKVTDFDSKSKYYQHYNDMIIKSLGISDRVDNSENQLFKYFASHDRHWVLKSDVKDTFTTLKEKGFKVGIISNFDSKLLSIVDRLGISDLVDYLHISQDEGYEKPQLEFYQSFFERHGLKANESSYCGDSYILDFLPVQSINIAKPLIIDPYGNYASRDEIIKNISDVLKVL